MITRDRWAKTLTIAGSIAMLVGALDPLEGSILILPGSGLWALGAFLGQSERPLIRYRVWVFILISFGVAALFGLSAVGGFGASSELSAWWGLFVLPYLVGWSLGIWGPGSPRWVLWGGIIVSLWYMAIAVMILKEPRPNPDINTIIIALVSLSLLTIGGCAWRLSRKN